MGFIGWMGVIGGLLLVMALISRWVRRLPLTTYSIYLAAGFVLGPPVLDLVHIDIPRDAGWLQRLTEATLIVSLFVGGVKLRVPLKNRIWRDVLRLASVAMLLGIGALTALAHWVFAFQWPQALMLAAMLSPTDPVLTSQVSVSDASDHDAVRIPLSGEAGLNDGAALPFLVLGLLWLKHGIGWPVTAHWALIHVLWAIPAGIGVGYVLGWVASWVTTRLYTGQRSGAPSILLMLALILLSYSVAEAIDAIGYVAVFAAGLGMRGAEMAIVRDYPHPEIEEQAVEEEGNTPLLQPPAEATFDLHDETQRKQPAGTIGEMMFSALSFGDALEHLLAMLLVLFIGMLLGNGWSITGVLMAAALFVLVRPAAVWVATIGAGLPWQRRALLGWLGLRGIGSLNYLAYAYTHGLNVHAQVDRMGQVVVTVVAASVVVHGISAGPLLDWRRRALERSHRSGSIQ